MKRAALNISIAVMTVCFLTQCKKSDSIQAPVDDSSKKELTAVRKETLGQVLTAAKNKEFRELVLSECLRQKHGDYYVTVQDLLSALKLKSGYDKIIANLDHLVKKTKLLTNGREPIIFYPKAETIETRSKNRTAARTESETLQEPIGVFQDVYNPDYSSPGYVLDNGNSLVYYQNITEEYAWDYDVWVIGEEENVSAENMVSAPEDVIAGRFQGQSEYGGKIQCTDLNAIEHWTSGKLEFKIFVFNSSGAQVSVRAFGKWARRNFRDQKWKDFGHFIGNWNDLLPIIRTV